MVLVLLKEVLDLPQNFVCYLSRNRKKEIAMPREYVNFKIDDRIALVTVDRPPVNALNRQVQDEIRDVFEEFQRIIDDVGAVIITGAGNKAFIAGADIKMITELGSDDALKFSEDFHAILNMVEGFNRVVIAAINGLALGGGSEVALACDIRVADESALFGFPEVGLGVMPGAGGTQRLARLVGLGKAKELILTGDFISASEAKSIGLVERIACRGEVVLEAKKIAGRVLLRGPLAIANAKRAINEGISLTLKDGLSREAQLFSELFCTQDLKEGSRAFLEKRTPKFIGH
jgi:enoyl-CoA hydratase